MQIPEDEISACRQVLQLEPTIIASFLVNIWEASSKIEYHLKDWNPAILVPVDKKVDEEDPANHRPIALMSQSAKMVEEEVAM